MPRKYIDIAGSGRIQVADGYSVRSAQLRTEKRQSSLSEPTQDLVAALGGERVISGERVNVDSSLRIADVFAAVSIITETIATLPLDVYRRVNGNVIETPEHRAAYMLGTAPNPAMPAHRFWATVAGHLLLWGNAYIEKLRDESGLVTEIWLIHPSQVTVEWNSELRQKRFVLPDKSFLTEDRCLHVYGFSSDGIYGLSPIEQSRQQLGLAKARERFEAEVYGQKPYLSGWIRHPGKINDTVKLRESWKAIYGGGDPGVRATNSRHGVAVLEEGSEYHQLTAPLADMEFVESQKLSRTTIANIFKLPPSYIGGSIGDSLTYQTVESNQIQFARNAIAPVVVNLQKFLGFDSGLFPFKSWYPEFVLDGLLRGDSVTRSQVYSTMFSIVDEQGKRALDVDEIRGLENRGPASVPRATIQPVSELEPVEDDPAA